MLKIKRDIATECLALASNYPVVTVLGPRQSGKTTLVRSLFASKPYVNLELPDIRAMAQADPVTFIKQYETGAIFDEIQRVPELLSYLQVLVDDLEFNHKPYKGLFILTGSHQLELHAAIAQSLAGRNAILNLFPLSIRELSKAGMDYALDEYILNGFYPRIYKDKLNPLRNYRNYVQTYLEKDVRKIINIKDLANFEKLIKLCAGRIGQILNVSSLANELGVSSHTVKQWISVLEASFIIIQLQPFYENFGKRLIKSPKLYFTDVGLASYLLGIENLVQLARDPLRGNLVENLVVLEMIKYRYNLGLDHQLYFYRDNNMNEIDLIFKHANELIPIEIKSSATFHSNFLKSLKFFKTTAEGRFSQGFLIYSGDFESKITDFQIKNFKKCSEIFEAL